MEIGARTRVLAIIGDPVGHSLSPAMHNAALRALSLDAVYVAFRTPAPALGEVLTAVATIGGAGNVTVPHKEAVERLVARKTELCGRAGACNTFWTEDGVIVGDNTDVVGIREALRGMGVQGGGRWLVLGTGGAARATLVVAKQMGGTVTVRSRHPDRAQTFAKWAASRGVRVETTNGEDPGQRLAADVAINATPLGLHADDPLPIPPDEIRDLQVALDLVYAPGETPWVLSLRRAGVTAQDGREMLIHQGAAAFERFFPDQTAPVEVMRAAVQRALRA
jgi:shikimate dehydrogenase